MSAKLGKFQMSEAQSFAGLVTANQLGLLFGNKPQLLNNSISKFLAGSNVNNLSTVLDRYPMQTLEEDEDFTWKLKGSDEKNVPLVRAYVGLPGGGGADIAGTDNEIGKGGVEFTLVFVEKNFTDVNMIVGEKNEVYQISIIADGENLEDGWHFPCRLMGASKQTGIPGEELVAQKRFSKDFSPVEDTMSIKGGGVVYNSPIDMRNGFTTIRMEEKVPGNMLNRRVAGTLVGTDMEGASKEFQVWMLYAEWEFEKQYAKEKSRGYMFARSNRDTNGEYSDLGKSGFYIKQGAGIREQMEVSNVFFADDITIELLESIVTDMIEGRKETDEMCEFMIRTGRRGAIAISKAGATEASGWTNLTAQNPALYKTTSSSLHGNALSGGFQFVEWLLPNNVVLKVEVDSMYDDKVRNKILHPEGGVAESRRMDIFFMGTQETPNIVRLGTKMGDLRGYQSGFRNAWTGEINVQYQGTQEDSATYTRYTNLGAAIIDSSRTATILPTMLA